MPIDERSFETAYEMADITHGVRRVRLSRSGVDGTRRKRNAPLCLPRYRSPSQSAVRGARALRIRARAGGGGELMETGLSRGRSKGRN
jgi:hypothetical protein